MPPKKIRTTKSKESYNKLNSTSTQTENDISNEIFHYENQIKVLRNEIEDYKKQIIILQSENNSLRNQNSNAVNNGGLKVGIKSIQKLNNEKILSPSPGMKISKGCSCKGNCANKICGCVKKGIPCQEFCRCNDIRCKNQEPEKENVEQEKLTVDGEKVLEKLGYLTLNQEVLHASEKKAKKSIFSPFGDRNSGITNRKKVYSASPLAFETKRRLFTQDSDDLVDIDTNTDEEKPKSKDIKQINCEENFSNLQKSETQFPLTPVAKRTRKLKDTENSEIIDSKMKQISNTTEINDVKENIQQELLKKKDKESYDEKKIKKEDKKNKSKDQFPSILITKNNEESSEDDVFLPNVNEKCMPSSRVLRKKSKSVSPDRFVVQRKYKNNKNIRKYKSRSVSPNEHTSYELDSIENPSNLGKVKHSPQLSNNHILLLSEDKNMPNNEKSREIQTLDQILPIENIHKNSESFESNDSENNSDSYKDILDVSLNPMVPKRQLPRSPINVAGTIILLQENKRFSPPKKELAVAEVDWEQHQSKLVKCNLCKRNFFPHRIEKHKAACKGI